MSAAIVIMVGDMGGEDKGSEREREREGGNEKAPRRERDIKRERERRGGGVEGGREGGADVATIHKALHLKPASRRSSENLLSAVTDAG